MMPFARSKKNAVTLPRIDIEWTTERESAAFGEAHVAQAGYRNGSRSEMQTIALDINSYNFKKHPQADALTQAFRSGHARIIVPVGARIALNRAKASFSYRMTVALNCLPARSSEPLCLWRANRDGAIMRAAHAERVEVNSLYEERIELPPFRDLSAMVTHVSVTMIYLVTASAEGSCLVSPTPTISPAFEIDRPNSDAPQPDLGQRHQSGITIKS